MHIRHTRIAHLNSLLGVMFSLLLLPALIAAPPVPLSPQLKASIEDYLAQLESDDYEARETATRHLQLIGREAVPFVELAADEGEIETRVRAGRILEQMLRTGDSETVSLALASLERLQKSSRPEVRYRVEQQLRGNREIVEKIILADFEALGGKFQRQGTTPNHRGVLFPSSQIPFLQLTVGGDYKGTQADLLRLRNVRFSLIIHRTSVKIDDETRQILIEANPGLEFLPRDLYLGIRSMAGGDAGDSIVVQAVAPNSTASQAGIQSGDRIVAVDGTPLTKGMDELRAQLDARSEGDKMNLSLIREDKPIEISVILRGP